MKALRFVSGLATLAIAITLTGSYSQTARAQAAATQRAPESWGKDNCLYTWSNGAWQRTQWCRNFPDPRNASVWDLFDAQRAAQFRFTIDQSGWIYLYNYPTKRTFTVANRNSVLDAMAQSLQQMYALAPQQAPAQAAESVPACLRGIAPDTVRVTAIPTTAGCQTPAEKKYMAEINIGAIRGTASNIEASRADARNNEERNSAARNRAECVLNHQRGLQDDRCPIGAAR
jgi:hypothetical protein